MCHLTAHMMERGSITHDVLAEHFMRVNGCSRQEFDEYYQKCREERMRREIDDTRGPVIWEQDWREYASLLAQEGNLKQRYQWYNGYIVSVGSKEAFREAPLADQLAGYCKLVPGTTKRRTHLQ